MKAPEAVGAHALPRRRLWRRDWIRLPDLPPDTRTEVHWLHLDVHYCDLRQPPAEQRSTAASLAGLDVDEVLALAGQEAFAGRLLDQGDRVEWTRPLSLHPAGPTPDAGRLHRGPDGALIETGVHRPYTERWVAAPPPMSPTVRETPLRGPDGRQGLLLRLGDHFGYVRDRAPGTLRDDTSLLDQLREAAPDIHRARQLVDFELSMGRIVGPDDGRGEVWRIVRSTLPWRVGTDLAPVPGGEPGRLTVADHTPEGHPTRTVWTLAVA
ncbi:hypothetical protein [Streptomyces profundus]|uniref:hypothetical protein n=1 Tax=Streptomyces profundus TaxID=2867410 RepID=UPI001D15F438|nr:hypothetical protein [Streptomyces sp. MA3_2.13]UED87273.1 hypothetical protein K4G22_26200 [Streptomyces sp. MA3_2.13]